MIKDLNYRYTLDVENLLSYLKESKVTLELLTDEQLIEEIMRNNKDDKVKDDSSIGAYLAQRSNLSNNHVD